tara:strand:+ start:4306 stop:5472 length:1167 start_codon:yes stop_codon:yes gene_type:complete
VAVVVEAGAAASPAVVVVHHAAAAAKAAHGIVPESIETPFADMPNLKESIEGARDEALTALAELTSEDEVEALRIRMLGRKGIIPAAMKEMGSLSPEERPEVGKVANIVKNELQDALQAKLHELQAVSRTVAVTGLDITLPGRRRRIGLKHPISRVMDECVAIFRRQGFIAADGPDIENEYRNFDALNTPADHPARDLQDTFYFPDGRLLRTHTSPVQIRVMESQSPPVRIVAPGRCYRRDTPDPSHVPNFHQIEGLYVAENVSLAELKGTLYNFAHEMFGKDVKTRFRPHFFPFTEPSIEFDISCVKCDGTGDAEDGRCSLCKSSGWLEVAGAGMVDPTVFEAVGYDTEKYTGFAFGMGIERIAALRYAITDIRLLYENNVRFLEQF